MRTKKMLALLLAMAMAVMCFTACTPKEAGNTNTGGEEAQTVKIGFLGPLTGGVAQYGKAVQRGVKLYVDLVNQSGGLNGKKVELVEYDEEGDQSKALVGYADLLDKGVVGIVGDVTTGPTVAVVQESQADGTPIVTASATAIEVTYNEATNTVYDNMFRSCFIDSFQGVTMANFAKEVCNVKTAAVLYDNSDTYSKGVYEYFVKQAKAVGLSVVAEQSYASGASDFSGQLTDIKKADPDVLFLPVYYSDVALIVKQANDIGFNPQLLGVDGWSTVLDAVTDPALVEGAYYCSGYSPEDTSPLIKKFLSDYAAAYPNEGVPGMFEAQGYDAAWILCNAIAEADSKGDVTNETVVEALKATNSDFVTGHVVFDDHNDPQKTAAIIKIEKGVEKFWGSK